MIKTIDKMQVYAVNDFESYKKDLPVYFESVMQEAKAKEWFTLHTIRNTFNEVQKLMDYNEMPKHVQKMSLQGSVMQEQNMALQKQIMVLKEQIIALQEQNAKTAYKPRNEISLCEKFALTIDEAAIYFGIGTKKLREMVRRYPNKGVFIKHGNKVLIKRVMFEKFLNGLDNI